jgi:4-cresol dehydrogenase (hydroxylating)
MDFSPIVPIDGPTILEALQVFGRVFDEAGITPLGGVPQFYHTRAMTIIYAVPTGKDPETNRKARETFAKLIEAAADHGWGEYRVHPAMMEQAVGVYSFNDHALRRLHETLKDAVDPNGILSAGRYGIWPKHLRETKA